MRKLGSLTYLPGDALSEEEFQRMIAVADADGSGSIDAEELYAMMTSL